MVVIGFLVRSRVGIRVRVGVMFNVSIYHWSNCRRSKCCRSDVTKVNIKSLFANETSKC